MCHDLVRMTLQQIRELATTDTTFFPVAHEGLDLFRHALDVEAEVVVDVFAWQAVAEGAHVHAGISVAFPL